MGSLLSAVWVFAVAALGWRPASCLAGTSAPWSRVALLSSLIGILSTTSGMWLLDLVGVAWTRTTLIVLVATLGLLSLAFKRRAVRGPKLDGAAVMMLIALGIYGAAAWNQMNVHSDVIFHWGQKAASNHLAGGLDYELLQRPWNAHLHPDYPNLVPTLTAGATLVHGDIAWAPSVWLSLVWMALLLLSLGQLAQRCGASRLGRWTAAVGAGYLAVTFAVGFRQAGGVDVLIAAAVCAAAIALCADADRVAQSDTALAALAAACAAASKIEGMPLAALILILVVVRHITVSPYNTIQVIKASWRSWLVMAVPTMFFSAYWLIMALHHDLLASHDLVAGQHAQGALTDRFRIVVIELWRVANSRIWYGSALALVVLPLLIRWRRSRWAALLVTGQLAFYGFAYITATVDPAHWIQTSGARLLFHVLPTAVVLAFASLDHWSARVPAHSDDSAD